MRHVAAPFSVHRVNWLYINKAALDKAGGKVPTTWPEFFAVADKMKAAGIQPMIGMGEVVAHKSLGSKQGRSF